MNATPNTSERVAAAVAELMHLVGSGHDVLIGNRGGKVIVRTLKPAAHPEFAWHYGYGRHLVEAVEGMTEND